MTLQRGQKTRPQGFGHFAAGHVPEPGPGERPEGHLQRAGPIDTAQEWIAIQPGLDLVEGFVQVIAAAG